MEQKLDEEEETDLIPGDSDEADPEEDPDGVKKESDDWDSDF